MPSVEQQMADNRHQARALRRQDQFGDKAMPMHDELDAKELTQGDAVCGCECVCVAIYHFRVLYLERLRQNT